jgi:hypothetical protein
LAASSLSCFGLTGLCCERVPSRFQSSFMNTPPAWPSILA